MGEGGEAGRDQTTQDLEGHEKTLDFIEYKRVSLECFKHDLESGQKTKFIYYVCIPHTAAQKITSCIF